MSGGKSGLQSLQMFPTAVKHFVILFQNLPKCLMNKL